MYEYCTVPELLVLVPYYLEIVLSTVRHACECRYSYSYVHHAGMLHTSTSTVLCCIRVLMPGSFLRFATLCNSTISARCPIKQNSFAKDDKFCQPGGPLDTRTRTIRSICDEPRRRRAAQEQHPRGPATLEAVYSRFTTTLSHCCPLPTSY